MHSTPNSKQGDDPHDILVVAPDVARVVPAEDQISELLHEAAARYRSDSQPHAGSDFPAGPMVRPVDTTFRPAAVNDVLARGKRGSIGQAGRARLHRAAPGSMHRRRRRRMAVLRRYGHKADRQVDDAARPDLMAAAGKTGVRRATGRACRSGGHGECSTSATGGSGSECCGSRPADRRRSISQFGEIAAVDDARSRKPGAGGRAAQGQHRTAQGQPATNVPRCWPRPPRSRLPSRTCGPGYRRFRRGRPPRGRASRCRHIRLRKRQPLPCCRKPPHLTWRGNLNPNRKPRFSRWPTRSCHRCRGRRCPCASAVLSPSRPSDRDGSRRRVNFRNQSGDRDLISRIFRKPGDCHEDLQNHIWLVLRSPSSARRLWPRKRLRERLPK